VFLRATKNKKRKGSEEAKKNKERKAKKNAAI
jgi:hypothetical protein